MSYPHTERQVLSISADGKEHRILIPHILGTPYKGLGEIHAFVNDFRISQILPESEYFDLIRKASTRTALASIHKVPMDVKATRITLSQDFDQMIPRTMYQIKSIVECRADGSSILTPSEEAALYYTREPDSNDTKQPTPDAFDGGRSGDNWD